MKCEICSRKIQTTFLEKIIGAVFKDEKGKKHYICNICQKETPLKKDQVLKLS